MKIRLRIFFVFLVFSFSLNGSNENSTNATNGVDHLLPVVCVENPQKQQDCTIPQLLSLNPDSLNVSSNVESQNSCKTQTPQKTVYCKNESSSVQKKTTMFKLLIKWIALLLELS